MSNPNEKILSHLSGDTYKSNLIILPLETMMLHYVNQEYQYTKYFNCEKNNICNSVNEKDIR